MVTWDKTSKKMYKGKSGNLLFRQDSKKSDF